MNNGIFCADVTKLIAADSFLAPNALRDPEAEDAFSDITTLLCNPFDIYFFRRSHLALDHLGRVARCWIEVASSKTSDANPLTSPFGRSSLPIVMNSKYADFFAKFYQGETASRAVAFVHFQSSKPELMRVFWSDNSEEELRQSYAELGANYRQVRVADWRGPIHYEFYRTRDGISTELHLESKSLTAVAAVVEQFSGKAIAGGKSVLAWRAGWMGCGRLSARFPLSTTPIEVAAGMAELIEMTRPSVTVALLNSNAATATA